ncbi:MAG: GGDEF domain-containing protein [Brevinematia bacterium]
MRKSSINSFIFSQLAVKCTKMLYKYKRMRNGLYYMMQTIFKFFKASFNEVNLFLYNETREVLKEEIRVTEKGTFVGRDVIPVFQLSKKLTENGEITYREFGKGRDIIVPLFTGKKFLGLLEFSCRENFSPPKTFCKDLKFFQDILSQGVHYLISRMKINEISHILKKISDINKKFIGLIELPNIEKRLIRIILEEMGFDRVIIYFVEKGYQRAIAFVGTYGKKKIYKYRVSLEEINRLIENKEIPLINVPLEINGEIKGGLIVDNFLSLIPLTREVKDFFMELSTELSLLFENSNMFKSIRDDAIFDHLTGLFRPKYFYERVDKELLNLKKAAFITIDFDFFKEINDTYGHPVGDKVLEIAGKIIKKNLRSTDVACRMGGDEFLIFLPNADKQKALKIADRIINHFKTNPIMIEDTKIYLSLSAGISVYPDDGSTREMLLATSDKALYRAKDSGRGIAFLANH